MAETWQFRDYFRHYNVIGHSSLPTVHGMGLAPVPYLFGRGWFRRGREPMCIVADPGSTPGASTMISGGNISTHAPARGATVERKTRC